MGLSLDKLLHFVTGLAVGIAFWWALDKHNRAAARQINPIVFTIMLIWGASGLFFFRKLGLPLLSHTFFYMAIPDWDIPLYQFTGIRLLIHRSWLFHSVVLPVLLLGSWWWRSRSPITSSWQRSLINGFRDGAMGLAVGMSAHLVWDAALSTFRRGFYIHGFGFGASYLWLFANVFIGLGVSWLIADSIRFVRNA